VITAEPYRLAREVWGIGFKTADTIARAVGIAVDAPERLQAGTLHTLGQAADDGHTLLPRTVLVTQAAELLGADDALVASAIESLLATGDVMLAKRDGVDDPGIALAPFARAESGLASRLHTLQGRGAGASVARIFTDVDWTVAFG
jgi:exodeoxyribonuclease V alpha subunit